MPGMRRRARRGRGRGTATVALAIVTCVAALAQEPRAAVCASREDAGGTDRPWGEETDALFLHVLLEGRLGRELGLTPRQLEALHQLAAPLRERSRELRRELERSAMAQARLISADPIDEAALMEAVERTGRIRTELAKVHVQALVALKRILTSDQMNRARQLLRQRAGHRHDGERPVLRHRGEGLLRPRPGRDGEAEQGRPAPSERAPGGREVAPLL